MNKMVKYGYEGIDSDIALEYSGTQDSNAVTTMSYVQLNITDAVAVELF